MDSYADVVTEDAAAGLDTVRTTLNVTLGDIVENGVIEGDAVDSFMIGNELNNVMSGSNATNVLYGLDGNDTLRGKGGADVLAGYDDDDELHGDAGRRHPVRHGRIRHPHRGSGDDVFMFLELSDSASGAADQITDFLSIEGRRRGTS